jgi:hypothetical protein
VLTIQDNPKDIHTFFGTKRLNTAPERHSRQHTLVSQLRKMIIVQFELFADASLVNFRLESPFCDFGGTGQI